MVEYVKILVNVQRLRSWIFERDKYQGWTWKKIEAIVEDDGATTHWFQFTNGDVHAFDYYFDYEFGQTLDNDRDRAIFTIKYKSVFWT